MTMKHFEYIAFVLQKIKEKQRRRNIKKAKYIKKIKIFKVDSNSLRFLLHCFKKLKIKKSKQMLLLWCAEVLA